MKLAQFVYINDSLNPIDFEKNLTISKGKIAILHWKFAFLVYTIVCICGQIFMKFAQFVFIINSLYPIDFEQNLIITKRKVTFLSL